MSSSTSSFDRHRRYVGGLVLLAIAPAACLLAIGVYLQPLYGDLTRIGAYSEREFGWNEPQRKFRRPPSHFGRYDRQYDVVVLGDSFSTGMPDVTWQNYLAAAEAWSVLTLDINQTSVEEVIATAAFRASPPKLFVLQTVERAVPRRVRNHESCRSALPDDPEGGGHGRVFTGDSGAGALYRAATDDYVRSTSIEQIKLDYVRNVLWRSFQRHVLGEDATDAAKVELGRPAPFSSTTNRAMLVYRDDMRKVEDWAALGIPQIACRLVALRDKVEANGRTSFVLMLAPDKLTAYADFLRDIRWRDASRLADLAREVGTFAPRIDLARREAIMRGENDVYLPNDTHWGSTGHRIAAEALRAFIRTAGRRRPAEPLRVLPDPGPKGTPEATR